MKIAAIGIDPQKDFCDAAPDDAVWPGGALPVPGAWADLTRAAKMIDRLGHRLDEIIITLDSHRVIDIAHAAHWVDKDGHRPQPFTIITHADLLNGIWRPRHPGWTKARLEYTAELERKGRYPLMIWPTHCLIGSEGATVHPELYDALCRWEAEQFAAVNYKVKGDDIASEHYSAMEAEVPNPENPATMLDYGLIQALAEYDDILLFGEALSHCLKATVEDIANNIGDQHISKLILVTDCTSPVPQVPGGPDFPAIGRQFIADMVKRGMRTTTSTTYLA